MNGSGRESRPRQPLAELVFLSILMRAALTYSTVVTLSLIGATLLILDGCAATGSRSSAVEPVLYPNDTLKRVGEAQGQMDAQACTGSAEAAGLTPNEKSDEIERRAGEGAAIGGVASTVGALIRGGTQGALRAAATGAALGGSAGAVSGAFHNNRPNATYRSFVQRCLRDKGFDVIGWN